MIYKNYKINASAPDWHYYEVNEDGTIGAFIDNGGISGDYEFDIVTNDEDEDSIDGGYNTLEEAKQAIDAIVKIKERLEYLRQELRAERISTSELGELWILKHHIAAGDVELLEAAGVPENI